jgi:hypothetical protein
VGYQAHYDGVSGTVGPAKQDFTGDPEEELEIWNTTLDVQFFYDNSLLGVFTEEWDGFGMLWDDTAGGACPCSEPAPAHYWKP